MRNERVFIDDKEYHSSEGVNNSTLLLMENNPSDVQWVKDAPVDVTNTLAADFGKALHTAILEPEKLDSSIYVSSVAGRKTKTFAKEILDNPDRVVLTEEEIQQIRVMQASGKAHPSFNRCLTQGDHFESSIYIHDKERDIQLKIRPDVDAVASHGFIANLKTTASLADWRSDRSWINPVTKYNYWHDACFSLYVASLFYGEDINTFKWACLQKSVSLGRYPVGCFVRTKNELVADGFYNQMLRNLDEYARRYHDNDWCVDEELPMFNDDGMSIVEVE